jgi:hypothetical protein
MAGRIYNPAQQFVNGLCSSARSVTFGLFVLGFPAHKEFQRGEMAERLGGHPKDGTESRVATCS